MARRSPRRPRLARRTPAAPRERHSAPQAAPASPPHTGSRWYHPDPFGAGEIADIMAGTRLRERVTFEGVELEVRPLSEPEVSLIRFEAMRRAAGVLDHARLLEAGTVADDLRERSLERELVRHATLLDGERFFATPADVESLDASTFATLLDAFARVQRRAIPVLDRDDAKGLAEQMTSGARHSIDAIRARFASDLRAFYGVPALQITDLQVVAFIRLRESST